MSGHIQTKATEWWESISSQDTVSLYRRFFVVTWDILKETATLLWLIFCFLLVSIGWFWDNSIQLGANLRGLVNEAKEKQADGNVAVDVGKGLVAVSKSAVASALWHARDQLKMENSAEKPQISLELPASPTGNPATQPPAAKTNAPAAPKPKATTPPPDPLAPAKTESKEATKTEETAKAEEDVWQSKS